MDCNDLPLAIDRDSRDQGVTQKLRMHLVWLLEMNIGVNMNIGLSTVCKMLMELRLTLVACAILY